MKKLFLLIFLTTFLSVFAIQFIDGERVIEITLEELASKPQLEIETHREKDGDIKDDKWIGADFKALLNELEVDNFDQLKFTSEDNYLVRVSKTDIYNSQVIIALMRNGKQLTEEKIRLVIPAIRDMYWIQGIINITVEKFKKMTDPSTIFIAENVISDLELLNEPKPFTKITGYMFKDLAELVFPIRDGDFLLISKDGIQHNLDYDKYLKNAVLIVNEGILDLRSPDMPGGMWIKNLAYVQIFDRAMIFKTHFESFDDVAELADWNEKTEVLMSVDPVGIELEFDLPFSNDDWKKVRKLKW